MAKSIGMAKEAERNEANDNGFILVFNGRYIYIHIYIMEWYLGYLFLLP